MAESRMTQIDSGQFSGDRPGEDGMLSVERVERLGESVILYDASLVNQMRAEWFEPGHWADAPVAPGSSGGRGLTRYIRCEGEDCVLRHYHRGGMIARIVNDGFLWTGEERTRSFAEWRLLARIHQAGLSAPRPLAARYVRRGLLYRADLITVQIPGVVPLSARLSRGALGRYLWQRIGACVARFHRAGFFHADLNAHNIQVNDSEEIFLLDFDRGRALAGGGPWQGRNLQRLHRSLTKISRDGSASFGDADWAALLEGYRETLAGRG
jgi:3-deoxy-D-manno-octulosonic acid kinase